MKLKVYPTMRLANKAGHARFRVRSGFTLIEIMVAVSLFAIVAVIVSGALVTISDVNRKAQAIKIAMDNVSFAMDSMVFNLREGEAHKCSGSSACTNEDNIVFVSTRSKNECLSGFKRYIGYRLQGGRIQTGSLCGTVGSTPTEYKDITSSEVDISKLGFYIPDQLLGAVRVTMIIEGQVPGKTQTNFYLQTTVKKI
ncbi:MAG: type II secretion system protein [Patescibacteria group bacterium]